MTGILASILLLSQPLPDAKPLAVLFVGNSYTYFNNLPEVFERIVSVQRPVVTGMLAPGGMTLAGHLAGKDLDKILGSRKWDYVVIQEQSTLSNDFTVDGVSRINDYRPFWDSVGKIATKIKATGAKPVLYMTWKRKAAPWRDQDFLDYAGNQIGQRSGCLLAPAGDAWRAFEHEEPKAELYYEDGSHPDETGTYIAAATLAETIAHVDLNRLPVHPMVHLIDLDEKLSPTAKPLGPDALQVRDVATAVRHAMTNHGARKEPAPILIPWVEGRVPVSLRQIVGTYSGSTTVYSAQPQALQISLDDRGAGIATIKLGNGQADFSTAIQAKTDGWIVTFQMPSDSGISALNFKGTFRDGQLKGICERRYVRNLTVKMGTMTKTIHAGQLAGFGHWSAKRG